MTHMRAFLTERANEKWLSSARGGRLALGFETSKELRSGVNFSCSERTKNGILCNANQLTRAPRSRLRDEHKIMIVRVFLMD